MGDKYDLMTFFHTLSLEQPNYVKWIDDNGGMVRVCVSQDENAKGFTIADENVLVVGDNGGLIRWENVTQYDILRAVQYVWKWLADEVGIEKASEGFAKNLPKIDYGKCKLGCICRDAFSAAGTAASFLDHNKEYILKFFSDFEYAQGIRFLEKLRAIHA